VLLAVAAAVRLYVLVRTAVIAVDGVEYIRVAKLYSSFELTGALGQNYPPVYPALIALFHLPGFSWELAGQLVSFAAGVLTLFPLFFLVRGVYEKVESGPAASGDRSPVLLSPFYYLGRRPRVALVAGLLLAFQPEMARYSGQVRAESCYIFFAMCAIYFGWHAISSGRARNFVLLGLFSTLSYLTRPEGLGFLIVALTWVVLGIPKRCRLPWRKRLAGIAFALLPALVIAGSYVAYISTVSAGGGEPLGVRVTLKRSVASLFRGEYISEEFRPGGESLPEELSFTAPVLGWLRSYAELLGRLLCKDFYPLLSLLLLLALLRRRENPRDGPFEAFVVVIVLFFVGLFSFVRVCHRLPVQLVAPLLFLPALGFFELRGIVRDRFKLSGKALSRVSAVILLVLVAAMSQQYITPERIKRQGVRFCGEWIKGNHPDRKPRIATDLARVVFYARGTRVSLPARYLDRKKKEIERPGLEQLITERGADYLALDADTISKADMEYLHSLPQLELIKAFKPVSAEGQQVVLFKLHGAKGAPGNSPPGQRE
jgi:hypothetical protein